MTFNGDGHPAAPMIAGHPQPARLLTNNDPAFAAWRAALPGLVNEVLEEWSLTAAAPFTPGGSTAWVAPVSGSDGTDLVLKVAWAHEESRDEAAGMAVWQGRGAAKVYRSELRGETSLLLMERVHPGVPLAELLSWTERDAVVAELLRQIWIRPSDFAASQASRFRPLSHMCSSWADEAQARANAGRSPLPPEVVARGLALLRQLPNTWEDPVLLATDLNPGNVLSSGHGEGRHWVLIDPKPYLGDPHYDVLQHMLNDPQRLTGDPRAFAERMAALTNLDPARTLRWLIARCVQEAGVMDGAAEAALQLAADETS